MNYKAGGYIQIEIPESEVNYKDMDITAHPEEHDSADKFKTEWDKFNLWPLVMKNDDEVIRAYSMASYPAEGKKIMLEKIPLGRMGSPEEIACVVKFLASSSGDYITGETIHVNGGLYMS